MIPAALRRVVWRRAQGRCEYCLIHDTDSLLPHEPDHVIAVQHGGPTTIENLALACFECNRFKGPNLSSMDSQTGEVASLFHPRRDRWEDHFRLEGVTIVPLTANGRATVALFRMNSETRLEDRETLIRNSRYPR